MTDDKAKAAAEKYVRECWHPDFPSEQAARALSEPFLAGYRAGVEAAAKVALRLERSMTCPKSPSHALTQCADEIRKLAE